MLLFTWETHDDAQDRKRSCRIAVVSNKKARSSWNQ